MNWKFTDAKNKFSQVHTLALKDPQIIKRRDGDTVLLSRETYDNIIDPKPTFIEHLMSAKYLHEIDLTRDKSEGRDIEL